MIEQSTPYSPIRRTLATCLLAGLMTALPACTSTSNSSRDDDATAAAATTSKGEWKIDHDGWAEVGYQWQWTGYPPMQKNAVIEHATAYDDLLTFVGSGSTVSVLEANTGKVRWSRQLDRASTRFVEPVRRDGTLYSASDTELWELDLRNGNTIDRDSMGTLINTKPLIVDNLAIFGTLAGELFAFQMDSDFKLWSYKFEGPINQPAITVNDGYIAAMSEKGDIRTLESVNAHSGMTAHIAGGSDAELISDGIGLYIASLDQSLYAFDVLDGYRFWRIRSSNPVSVQHTLHEGVLYASTKDRGMMAIDSATGEMLWNNPEVGGWVLTVADDSELIAWSGFEMLAIDKERGDILARTPLQNISGVRTNSVVDGDIYVITYDGGVAKFSHR